MITARESHGREEWMTVPSVKKRGAKGHVDTLDFQAIWRPFRENTTRFQECFAHHSGYQDLVAQSEVLAGSRRS